MANQAIEQYLYNKFTSENNLSDNEAVETTYAFSNENLRQYIDLLNIRGGRVATVGSSGDQAFYSVFKDAEEVTLIDGNPYAKPMVELKRSAILNMDFEEFINFWTKEKILNPKDLPHLLGDVSGDSREFFEFVMQEMNKKNSYQSISQNIVGFASFKSFFVGNGNNEFSNGCEFYDDVDTYNILKSKLKDAKINYQLAEYMKFPRQLDGKYSSILLSNIYTYVDHDDFFYVAKNLIDNNLAKNGTMQMHYEMGKYPSFQFYAFGRDFKDGKINTYLVEDPVGEDVPRLLKCLTARSNEYPKKVREPRRVCKGEELVYIYEK